MMVVFLTSFSVGHETRLISARMSRRNCARRLGPTRGLRNAALAPGGLAFRSFTKARRARRDYRCVWIICLSHDSLNFVLPLMLCSNYWQGYQDSNPDFGFGDRRANH